VPELSLPASPVQAIILLPIIIVIVLLLFIIIVIIITGLGPLSLLSGLPLIRTLNPGDERENIITSNLPKQDKMNTTNRFRVMF
jgi:hypothetical protein